MARSAWFDLTSLTPPELFLSQRQAAHDHRPHCEPAAQGSTPDFVIGSRATPKCVQLLRTVDGVPRKSEGGLPRAMDQLLGNAHSNGRPMHL